MTGTSRTPSRDHGRCSTGHARFATPAQGRWKACIYSGGHDSAAGSCFRTASATPATTRSRASTRVLRLKSVLAAGIGPPTVAGTFMRVACGRAIPTPGESEGTTGQCRDHTLR